MASFATGRRAIFAAMSSILYQPLTLDRRRRLWRLRRGDWAAAVVGVGLMGGSIALQTTDYAFEEPRPAGTTAPEPASVKIADHRPGHIDIDAVLAKRAGVVPLLAARVTFRVEEMEDLR